MREIRILVVNADREARGRDMDPRVTFDQIGPMMLGAVGARQFVFDRWASRLIFTITRGHRQVAITLEADDTYTVKTNMKKSGREVFRQENVYCDELAEAVWQAHIEKETAR